MMGYRREVGRSLREKATPFPLSNGALAPYGASRSIWPSLGSRIDGAYISDGVRIERSSLVVVLFHSNVPSRVFSAYALGV